jgi:predicted lysophospholipase L1 biosynthesis ABC-type transport system permease subunit
MISRNRIALEYLGLGVICAIVASIASTLVQDWLYVPVSNIHWRPRHDVFTMLELIWFGMLLHFLLPTGWIFWAGLGFALRFRNRWYYAASIISSGILGVMWPRTFWALMSV